MRAWVVVVVLAVVTAACSSSSKTATAASASGPPSSSSASAPTDAAAITVSATNIGNLGMALVNGKGLTLYVLSSEQGGKITCTDDNGCTKVWPDTELPSGTAKGIAGTGVDASLLGTTKSASGDLYLTYAGFPLYTFSGDGAPGQANGEGIMSFGGTWSIISPAGAPVTTPTTAAADTVPAMAPTTAAPQAAATSDAGAPPATIAPPATTAPPDTTTPPSTATTAPPTTTTTLPPTTGCLYPPCY